MGADPQQTLQAFREAEAYDGPSLILAYSHCIAHGIDMRNGLDQQYRAVASGYWPLIRYDPVVRAAGGNPFLLDSPRPRVKEAVTVPVAVKLSPYFSSTGEMALRLDEAGADALVLFNRFLQPDIDPETLAVVPQSASRARPRRACRAPGSRSCAGVCARRSRRPPASRRPPTWPGTCWPAPTW
jgi:hypothetical protein